MPLRKSRNRSTRWTKIDIGTPNPKKRMSKNINLFTIYVGMLHFFTINMPKVRYMGFVDRLCRRSATFLTKFAIFAGWQSPLQKYISLPLHTSVSGISKRHAHKVFIKCPVSKLRLRLQTVETGHYFCSLCR